MAKLVTVAPFNKYEAPKGVSLRKDRTFGLNVFHIEEAYRLNDRITHKGRRVTVLKRVPEWTPPVRTPLPANPTREDRIKDAFETFYWIDGECGSKSIAYSVIEQAHGREIAELVAAET